MENTDIKTIKSANPYLPLWEHIPDGEPRVFTYNGETRIYIYGSHDTMKTEYCGPDYVVWSAPVDDLTNWTCHGECYRASDGGMLYAPDVVQKGDTFYMYAAESKGSVIMLAKSKTPWGPFTDPVKTELGFDPGILVDDDGRVYAFWGFCESYAGELNDDMCTLKKETVRPHLIGHSKPFWIKEDDGHVDPVDGFFEASSPRKVNGKYVLIYSKRYEYNKPQSGVFGSCNGFLSYKWCDTPLGDYQPGGDISFNGGEVITGPDGNGIMTYQWGNNHGSLMQIKDKWYVFYHRQTGCNEFARQGMVDPVDVAVDKNGKIFIGKITYENGEPVSSDTVEMTSQGFNADGLDAFSIISAGYACHIYDGTGKPNYLDNAEGTNKDVRRAHISPVYEGDSSPVVDIQSGATVGFRYLDFGADGASEAVVTGTFPKGFTVSLMLDSYDGREIAVKTVDEDTNELIFTLGEKVVGKHAVYFGFKTEDEAIRAVFDTFRFK
ncbi:family 43 glycosylhydrolase [Butyrivibrio sp. AE2032]|uniref:family 43 glycosylhydrolase n=1 Tax=Butyrivibrio sp. AE2032 TaxID=1458463 RepID=UPI000690E3B1|nr:family 43 glycosylhydrolase [Butyrivibrio sp. AE2032]